MLRTRMLNWQSKRHVAEEYKLKMIAIKLGCLGLALIGVTALGSSDPSKEYHIQRRSLLSGANKAEWEKCDFEKDDIQGGWIALYIFVILHMFVGIAILCDDYFVPVLEDISEALNLSEDVAGATFMAAGSSAPELFTSLAGVTVDSDVGVGTIVGSAVFNILVIVAMSAAFAASGPNGALQVDWRCLLRDALHYAIAIGAFIWFVWDGRMSWWESVILILLYFVYLLNMKFNQRIMQLFSSGGKVTPIILSPDNCVESALTVQNVSPSKSTKATELDSLARATGNEIAMTSRPDNAKEGSAGQFPLRRQGSSRSSMRRCSSLGDLNEDTINRLTEIAEQISVVPATDDDRDGDDAVQIPLRKTFSRSDSALNRSSNAADEPIQQFHVQKAGRLSTFLTGRSVELQNEIAHRQSHHLLSSPLGSSHSSFNSKKGESLTDSPLQDKTDDIEVDDVDVPTSCIAKCCFPCTIGLPEIEHKTGPSTSCTRLSVTWVRFKWLTTLVYDWAFLNTIPPRRHYWSSFFVCILWIMILSFVMVTAVVRLGCIIGIDDYVMGLVIVAAGTSVPDAMGSILVANQGYADMAVANALGSNVFDIDLGMGIPFLIKSLIIGRSFDLLSEKDRHDVDSGSVNITDHVKFGFILLGILVMTMLIFKLLSFKLNKQLGIGFIVMYLVFIAYALIQEIVCKRNDERC